MLYEANTLIGNNVVARDGHAGRVKDIVVDSAVWSVQYVVARKSRWLSVCDVLIPRGVIDGLEDHRLRVAASKCELKPYVLRPGRDDDSVDGVGSSIGGDDYPVSTAESQHRLGPLDEREDLRGVKSVRGALVQAIGGTAGRVKDVVVNPSTWHVMGVVVGTRGHLPGKKVLVPIQFIEGIDAGGEVHTDLPPVVVRNGPRLKSRRRINPKHFDDVVAYYTREVPPV